MLGIIYFNLIYIYTSIPSRKNGEICFSLNGLWVALIGLSVQILILFGLINNESIKSFYTHQVLGKSVKPIPVMILGVLVARKRYPLQKYLFVLMIVIGVALFVYKDKKTSSGVDSEHTIGWGETLLVGNKNIIVLSV